MLCRLALMRLTCLLLPLAATVCKYNLGETSAQDANRAGKAEAAGGINVNDVCMLLPLPSNASAIGSMLPLSLPNADGKPWMSEALFNDLLGHFKYQANLDGATVGLFAGADFAGDRKASARSINTSIGRSSLCATTPVSA